MPTLTAATQSRTTAVTSRPGMRWSASVTATNAPGIAAVRVPPSAWITSQSTHTVRSPSFFRSKTARTARDDGRGAWRLRAAVQRRAHALIPVLLVLGDAVEDRARDLVTVPRLPQLLFFLRVRDEADLDEHRRHRGAAQHVEPGLLHAA